MKNTLLFAALAALASGLAFGGTITVTQPAGGSVNVGDALTIAWTSSGVTGNFKIQLIKPGGALVGLLLNNVASSPQTWTVGAPAVGGEQYRIRVRAIDGSGQGESAIFAVGSGGGPGGDPGTISLVKLSGTPPYCLGKTYTVSWTVNDVPQNLKLQLLQSGALIGPIVTGLAPGTSSYSWKAGDYSGGTAGAGTDYQIRVTAMGGTATATTHGFELKTCDAIDPGILEKIKRIRYMVRIPPFPDPCLCPEFDLGRIREFLGDLKGNVKLVLLLNGSPIHELGQFGPGNAMPSSLKSKMSSENYGLLSRGVGKFSLGLFDMSGKLLNEFAMEGAAQLQ